MMEGMLIQMARTGQIAGKVTITFDYSLKAMLHNSIIFSCILNCEQMLCCQLQESFMYNTCICCVMSCKKIS